MHTVSIKRFESYILHECLSNFGMAFLRPQAQKQLNPIILHVRKILATCLVVYVAR